MIRVAIIGVTGYGRIHFEGLRELWQEGRVKVVAAVIINREEAAEACEELEQVGATLYSDYQEMFRAEHGKIDLCCIPTGISWHCPMTVAALQAGAHVLLEKPVAATLAEVDTMIAARDAAKRQVIVGYQDLCHAPILHMKQRILAGDIGQTQTVRLMACWPRPVAYYERNDWAGRVKVGDQYVYDSPANNALAHYVIASLYFTAGKMDSVDRVVSGEGELYRAKPIESFDTMSVRVKTVSEAEILITLTHSCPEVRSPVIEIHGSAGSIRWDFDDKITHQPSGESLPAPAGPGLTKDMIRQMVGAIEAGGQIGCTLEMAREHTRLINALHEHCPIHDVPATFHGQGEFQDSPLTYIEGSMEAADKTFREGKLFSELGLPWAQPAAKFQV